VEVEVLVLVFGIAVAADICTTRSMMLILFQHTVSNFGLLWVTF
jgi:hypothetical protein